MEITLTILILSGLFGFFYFKLKKENERLRRENIEFFEAKDEMKLTLLKGLYHRYKQEEDPNKEENPLMFEYFVAKIFGNYYKYDAYVTPSSGDYGVDIEQRREDGLYLGQVKCYAPNNLVNYEPIAIIHSQMLKQNAVGGFVITTSKFSSNAIKYAKDLKIDLIDGPGLINMWIESTERQFRKILVNRDDKQKEITTKEG